MPAGRTRSTRCGCARARCCAPSFPAPLGMRGLTMMRVLATLNGLVNAAGGAGAGGAFGLCHHADARHSDEAGESSASCWPTASASATARGPTPTASMRSISSRRRTIRSSSWSSAIRCGCAPMASSRIAAAPGRYRGGCGIVREYEILADEAVLAVRIDSVEEPALGHRGRHVGRRRPRRASIPGTADERCWRRCPTATC